MNDFDTLLRQEVGPTGPTGPTGRTGATGTTGQRVLQVPREF